MQYLDLIFGYYDRVTAGLAPTGQALVAILLLVFLVWQVFGVIRSGHWIFVAGLLVFLPGTWPAAKHVANLLWLVVKFLLTRAQGALG
ncbi:MAG: hypothetical protein AAB360_03220 [Patescibacteria group bacterium]